MLPLSPCPACCSLSYIQTCVKKARGDIAALQGRRAALEEAKRFRPFVRRT